MWFSLDATWAFSELRTQCPKSGPERSAQYNQACIEMGVNNERCTSRRKKLSNAPARGDEYRALSDGCRHRAIGSLLREGLWRAHSEPPRRQGLACISSACEYMDDSERWGRANTGQADGNAQRP